MKKIIIIALLLLVSAPAAAHFPNDGGFPSTGVGPVSIGQAMAQVDDHEKVSIVQLSAPSQSGGILSLKAFGWLEPYVETLVQLLIAAAFSWFAKTKYGQMMDKESREALEVFLKNRAGSLIADGAVSIEGKSITVNSTALAAEINAANRFIPGALKRFGLTPQAVGEKIVDAIPQIAAGAAIVAQAHSKVAPLSDAPPTAASS
jgi:hypothetical protein